MATDGIQLHVFGPLGYDTPDNKTSLIKKPV